MTPQYLGNKALLSKKHTAFFASHTVQIARVMACYDWGTSLDAEINKVLAKHYELNIEPLKSEIQEI